ncbi:MAG TPA: response regulator [Pirellulales bacterium]|nr:response regulator [Pirellulales bacterium]
MIADSGIRVLVVDDESAAMSMANLLRHYGHQTLVAATGEIALQQAPQLKPDAVFIDLTSPVLDGLAVARRLRQMPAFVKTPLVALTDDVDPESRTQATTAGFDELLVRPYSLTDLLAIVTRVRKKIVRTREQIARSHRAATRSRRQNEESRAGLDEHWRRRQRLGAEPTPLVSFLGWDATPNYDMMSILGEDAQIVALDSFRTFLDQSDGPAFVRRQCLVVDGTAADVDALTAVAEMADRRPSLPVVVLVASGNVRLAVALMKAGAFDVVEKSIAEQELADVIACAIEGAGQGEQIRVSPSTGAHRLGDLTDVERRLLEFTVAGELNKQIARKLEISLRTVHLRRAALLKKTGARNRAELIRIAVEAGIGASV